MSMYVKKIYSYLMEKGQDLFTFGKDPLPDWCIVVIYIILFLICAVLSFFLLMFCLRSLKKMLKNFFRMFKAIFLPGRPKGFARIAGMEEIKEEIYNDIIFPFYNAKKYKKFHLALPNGLILYGPPGCGKTFFVERLSEELEMNYIKVSHADLASPYIHATVAKISDFFEKAKASAPCLFFIDELEGVVPSRDQMGNSALYKHEEVNEFLLNLDNASKNGVLVIGATNHLDQIDSAVLRSGRFDIKIYIAPPDFEARKALFNLELKNMPHQRDIDLDELALLTENYTNSDIVNIVKKAAREAVAYRMAKIDQNVLRFAIQNTPSSLKIDKNDTNVP